jgi:hypothetical protein
VLLVVPEVPNQPSRKPLVQGFGCRLGGGHVSCEALFVATEIPTQTLAAELRERHKPPTRVSIAWSGTRAGLYQNASIDTLEET